MTKHYFRLLPHCEFVRGPRRAAVYDLARCEVLHCDEAQSAILDQCERNIPIDEITSPISQSTADILNDMVKRGLGMYYTVPPYVEKFRFNSPLELPGLFEPPPIIRLAYLQVTTSCNLACNFCGQPEIIPWLGCNSCLRWTTADDHMAPNQEKLSRVIDSLMALEVMNVHISGGNPLLQQDTLKFIIDRIRQQQAFPVGICLYTNGTAMPNDFLDYVQEKKVEFRFSLFGNSAEDYQTVCGDGSIFAEVQRSLQECQKRGIVFDISVILSAHTYMRWKELRESAQALGSRHVFFTELVRERDNRPLAVSPVPVNAPRDNRFTREYFIARKRNNICLAGNLAIDINLQLRPCPMIATNVGNLGEEKLYDIIKNGKLKPFWTSTKSSVPVCQNCELRYLCADCSLIEMLIRNRLAWRNVICGYDPMTGQWPVA